MLSNQPHDSRSTESKVNFFADRGQVKGAVLGYWHEQEGTNNSYAEAERSFNWEKEPRAMLGKGPSIAPPTGAFMSF